MTRDLTLRLPNTYMYVFQAFFLAFALFKPLTIFSEGRSKIMPFYTKTWVKMIKSLGSYWTSSLLGSNPVQQNYRYIFKDFKPKSTLWGLNETNITSKKAFNGIYFKKEGNHESNNWQKWLFWVFSQIFDSRINP